MIAWVYGSGFPKSLDVSKAIDKARGDEQEWKRIGAWLKQQREASGHTRQSIAPLLSGHRNVDSAAANMSNWENGLSFPTWDRWEELRSLLKFGDELDAEVWRLNGRKGQPGDTWQTAEVIGEHEGATPGFGEHRFNVRDTKIRAASETAAQWQGWGTALKPALEPITVARKPLAGTVATNVLEHGTGALNIDGCRVAPTGESRERIGEASQERRYTENGGTNFAAMPGIRGGDPAGRWPANLIHDGSDEVLAAFPYASCAVAAVRGTEPSAKTENAFGEFAGRAPSDQRDGGGSAARFFYCAKASRSDRNDGLPSGDAPAVGTGATMREREDADWPARNGNFHPTVKPTDLMRYLCRLVTPPGGIVLDPFMGSGSTGKAAMLEGFRFIGCDLSADYLAIARARIEAALASTMPRELDAAPADDAQLDLFAA